MRQFQAVPTTNTILHLDSVKSRAKRREENAKYSYHIEIKEVHGVMFPVKVYENRKEMREKINVRPTKRPEQPRSQLAEFDYFDDTEEDSTDE